MSRYVARLLLLLFCLSMLGLICFYIAIPIIQQEDLHSISFDSAPNLGNFSLSSHAAELFSKNSSEIFKEMIDENKDSKLVLQIDITRQPKASFKVREIFLPYIDNKQTCIADIMFSPTSMLFSFSWDISSDKYELNNVCESPLAWLHFMDERELHLMTELDPIHHYFSKQSIAGDLPVNMTRSLYYFPFDTYKTEGYFTVTTYEKDEKIDSNKPFPSFDIFGLETKMEPQVAIIADTKGWDPELMISKNHIVLNLKRPLALRASAVLLLASMFVIIFSLIFISDTGAVLQMAIGILLGLWGIRNILVPSYIDTPTIIDHAILIMYILLAFMLFIRFLIRPLWMRLIPKTEIESVLPSLEIPPLTQSLPVHILESSPNPQQNKSDSLIQIAGWLLMISMVIAILLKLRKFLFKDK